MANEPKTKQRPGKYTEELANEICKRIADGETLRAICRDEHMPSWVAVYDWIVDKPDFALRIERARETGADAIAQDILDIADDGRNDWMEKLDRNGVPVGWMLNGEHVRRSSLRVDARLKLLAKWHPKKYGDKTITELTGKDGGPIKTDGTLTLAPEDAYLRLIKGEGK